MIDWIDSVGPRYFTNKAKAADCRYSEKQFGCPFDNIYSFQDNGFRQGKVHKRKSKGHQRNISCSNKLSVCF